MGGDIYKAAKAAYDFLAELHAIGRDYEESLRASDILRAFSHATFG